MDIDPKVTIVRLKCECCDPRCPVHGGISECKYKAVTRVRRIDMEDGKTTFNMCKRCAVDALESGVFA